MRLTCFGQGLVRVWGLVTGKLAFSFGPGVGCAWWWMCEKVFSSCSFLFPFLLLLFLVLRLLEGFRLAGWRFWRKEDCQCLKPVLHVFSWQAGSVLGYILSSPGSISSLAKVPTTGCPFFCLASRGCGYAYSSFLPTLTVRYSEESYADVFLVNFATKVTAEVYILHIFFELCIFLRFSAPVFAVHCF